MKSARIVFICLSFIFNQNFCFCQYSIEWQKCLGGTEADEAFASCSTGNGGIILIGATNSTDLDVIGNHGMLDFWVVKLDSNGTTLWKKCYGGTQDDAGFGIVAKPDSGYVLTGYTNSNDGDVTGNHGLGDLWLVEINENGDLIRQKCFGGTQYDEATSLHFTQDGSLIVIGNSDSDDGDVTINNIPGADFFWAFKLDSAWNIVWQNGFLNATPYLDFGRPDLMVMPDKSIAYGCAYGDGFYYGRADSAGNLFLQMDYGGSDLDFCLDMDTTSNQQIILFGDTRSNNGSVYGNHKPGEQDFWIIRIDSSGAIKRGKCLGGTGNEYGRVVNVLNDNQILVAGMTESVFDGDLRSVPWPGGINYWVVLLDSNFNILRQQRFGGGGYEMPTSMFQVGNGKCYITGYTASNNGDVNGNHGSTDFWVIKLFRPEIEATQFLLADITGNCTLTDTEHVSINIVNRGWQTISNFNVSYAVNGGSNITENFTDSVSPGDTVKYTFSTPVDMSVPGIYHITSNISVNGDTNSTDDNSSMDVTSISHLNVPMFMGFENPNDFLGYSLQDIDGDSFTGDLYGFEYHSGLGAFRFGLVMHRAPDNILWTPCIDLNASSNYLISYWVKSDTSRHCFTEAYFNSQPDLSGATFITSTLPSTGYFYTNVASNFVVPVNGSYYIGFRNFSDSTNLPFPQSVSILDDILIDFANEMSVLSFPESVGLYPNPANDRLSLTNLQAGQMISVHDLLGNILFQKEAKGSSEILSIAQLPDGLYFVTIGNTQRLKFVKQ